VATVDKDGVQLKSLYAQLVATVAKSALLAYGAKSQATTVPIQVVYQQPLVN
jgi:hypothetical protein